MMCTKRKPADQADGQRRDDPAAARDDDRRVALAGLLRCCEPPAPNAVTLFVESYGPIAAWRAIRRRHAPDDVMATVGARLGEQSEQDLQTQACRDVATAVNIGADIIGPGDEGWPAESLGGLAVVPPYDKCSRAGAPLALYHRGSRWPTSASQAVAVVGARSATPYGVRVASELAGEAVTHGYTVVSGGAFGIDVAAHRGALGSGPQEMSLARAGHTTAVLACGIDRAYPLAHRDLLDEVTLGGAVLTEYPPGAAPARYRFLVRNRLIAALAAVTVVVEAGRRSGSLNTATTAGNLMRPVLAIPGPVTSAMSIGCHDLLRDCKAQIATGWADVASLVGPIAPGPPTHRVGSRSTDSLDLVTAQVYEALPSRGSIALDAIGIEAGLAPPDVLGALGLLELGGMARRSDGGWQRI